MDANGRASNGRFEKGHSLSQGKRNTRRSEFNARLRDAVTDEDFEAIVGKLIEEAKQGEPWAVKEALDRLCGKPTQDIEVEGAGLSVFKAIDRSAVEDV